jgi:hypothetical protein
MLRQAAGVLVGVAVDPAALPQCGGAGRGVCAALAVAG